MSKAVIANPESPLLDENATTLRALRELIYDNEAEFQSRAFGLRNLEWANDLADRWFDDLHDYNGRWSRIDEELPPGSKILDMSAGCGTFLQFGLRSGHDVYGVEPEAWKVDYYRRKVDARGDPARFKARFIPAIGEALPFRDNTFDLVTTYGTLDYVTDVEACIAEILRVLKPNGSLHIVTGDHSGFFEPNYRVLQFPYMSKAFAQRYLASMGKPLVGLNYLQWLTRRRLLRVLSESKLRLEVQDNGTNMRARRIRRLQGRFGLLSAFPTIGRVVVSLRESQDRVRNFFRITESGRAINLWVRKLPDSLGLSADEYDVSPVLPRLPSPLDCEVDVRQRLIEKPR